MLDPLNLAGGTDRWDPLLGLDPEDVLELQSMARALLPEAGQTSEAGAFFRDRAGVLIVAALQCVIRAGQGAPEAAALVRDPTALRAALEGYDDAVAQDARGILDSDDEKSRASILTTAAQGFSWMLDTRMQQVVTGHSFSLDALCTGDTDLYIVLPADDRRKELSAYVRWLLAALFSTVRRTPVAERLLVIIDEAYVLGRFDAILRGAGELPGYGVSLWTFWQSEAQITDTYGEAGAAILRDTAEALMLFNLSGAQGAERERWSSALGTFTGVQETVSRDPTTGRETKSVAPGPEALVPASELARLTQRHTLVFLNSAAYTTDPLKLRKTLAHRDARFAGLLNPVAPVRATARGPHPRSSGRVNTGLGRCPLIGRDRARCARPCRGRSPGPSTRPGSGPPARPAARPGPRSGLETCSSGCGRPVRPGCWPAPASRSPDEGWRTTLCTATRP